MQAAGQPRRRRTRALRGVAGAAIALLIGACQSGGPGRGGVLEPSPPDWVQDLREPLQQLPAVPHGPAPDSEGPADRRVGQPTELGRPVTVSDPNRPGASGRSPAPTPRSIAGGVSVSAPDRITVNVNGLGLTSAPAPDVASAVARTSALEDQYRGDLKRSPDRTLRQFGYGQIARLAAPDVAVAGPADADHVIVPGDEVIIDLITDRSERFRTTVDSDGTLAIEGLGSLRVAGLRASALDEAVRAEISRTRVNFDLSVGLGRLAGVQVRVIGEVESPGLVPVGSTPSLLDALAGAGVLQSGSLRRIVVERSDGKRVEVDLYGYLLGLASAPQVRLAGGDTVRVPAIGQTVGIAGSVQRPGIYELHPEDPSLTARGAIEMAGGGTGFAIVDTVQVERTQSGRRVLLDVDAADDRTLLEDGDLVLVGAVDGRLQPIVEVRGEVARPGRFQHRDGMRASDLVELAGGLTVDAFDGQAIVSRVTGSRSARGVVWDGPDTRTARRVIVIDLSKAMAGDAAHDVALEPLDLIRIGRLADAHELPTVEIIGASRRPGVYELTAGLAVGDLIAIAGNLAPDAYREEAELVRRRRRATGSLLDIDRFRLNLAPVLSGASRGPLLTNGDRLIIRRLTRAEVRVRAGGEVRFPGEYVLPAGARITDLLSAAGGLSASADLRAARFSRESVRQMQNARWAELTERAKQTFERNLERRVNSARSKEAFAARIQLEQAEASLERLRRVQANGRIVLPFMERGFPGSESDLVLENGDSIDVPRYSRTISVQGHVFNPLTVVHQGDLTADRLIERAGGLNDVADRDRIYVVRADGEVSSVSQRGGRFRMNDPLLPGDIVLVPPRPLGRDAGSVMLDALLLARTAGEAVALWNFGTGTIGDGSLSVVDSPASPRLDSTPPAELLREFQN